MDYKPLSDKQYYFAIRKLLTPLLELGILGSMGPKTRDKYLKPILQVWNENERRYSQYYEQGK